jgi:hypothetical protein
LAAAVACILAATLTPAGTEFEPEFAGCLVCGAHGVSDVLVNLILFAPLGAALALNGRTGARAVLLGGMLSCGVELAQMALPGRDPSLGDVTFNTLGTAAGQVAFWLAGRWMLPDSRTAARLALGAAIAATALFAGSARMLEPWLPARAFSAWYTADLPDLEWYHGRVLRTALGPLSFGPDRMPDRDAVRRLLLEGAPLRIDAIAARRVHSLAPLFVILDDDDEEIFLVGPDRDDLVLRYRSRAARWRLDQPDLRLRHAFASVAVGDTLRIAVRREGNGYCLSLAPTTRCGIGYTIGSGWSLLYYPRHLPSWMVVLLEMGWIAGLLFPLGLWARRNAATTIAIALPLVALFVLPPLTGLVHTPPHQLAGAVLGLLSGGALQAWLRRRAG